MKTEGLEAGVLDNDDTKYSIALSCFFVTYILLSIPGTLLAKQFNPSRTIAIGALIWSIGSTCQAAAFNPAGLYVTRLFVGVGEAMFGESSRNFHFPRQCCADPSLIMLQDKPWPSTLLSGTRRKNWRSESVSSSVLVPSPEREPFPLSSTFSLTYSLIPAACLFHSFSGLISFGVNHIHSSIAQYKILFLIEGLPSFVLAAVVFFFLPSRPEISKFLTEEERTVACTRLNSEHSTELEKGIIWADVRYAMLNWRTYVVAVSYSCMNLGL